VSEVDVVRVLVTGATGFVGSHAVRGLLDAGHEVRALVRSRERLAAALGEEVVARCEVLLGDVTEPADVEAGVGGCDAVLHAAGMVAVDARQAAQMHAVNVGGTRNVLRAAVGTGCDPILNVSSLGALLPPTGPVLTADDPVRSGASAYARSKAQAEMIARELQEQGAPVTTVYPGGIWGPEAPVLGETMDALASIVRRRVVPDTSGGMPAVDVRDVAEVLVAATEPGRGPRRFMLGGTLLSLRDFAHLITELTGRRMLLVPAPAPLLRGVGRAGDQLRRVVPMQFPLTHEAMEHLTRMVPSDDDPTLDALGVRLRPVRDTVADALRWLADAGHLPAKVIGRLADG
jgi:dihydroflavonol-4-reductase